MLIGDSVIDCDKDKLFSLLTSVGKFAKSRALK